MALKCDAVFEGGGVKGIGLAGAVAAIEQAGYEFENLAGTSAGAIVASLLAVDYTGQELGAIMETLDYRKFKDPGGIGKAGPAGKAINLSTEYGIYEGDFLETWLQKLLAAKGKTTFGDIRMPHPTHERYVYKFQAIASDVTERRMLVLPGDLKDFGQDIDSFPIAKAVRMSMSIPLFYEPFKLTDAEGKEHLIVDGGVLSNYPIWLLDDATSNPDWPTFGFKLVESDPRNQDTDSLIHGLPSYLEALVSTMMDAHDNYHISNSRGDYQRTIPISTRISLGGKTKKIRTTYFDITLEESRALFENGRAAAENFLSTWDFADWKAKYRQKP